jgi:hypothetical protein
MAGLRACVCETKREREKRGEAYGETMTDRQHNHKLWHVITFLEIIGHYVVREACYQREMFINK